MGRLGNGPSLQWAEFAMGRDVHLPYSFIRWRRFNDVSPAKIRAQFVRE